MIVPVILSGGSGDRLWPLSRKLYPKQFISLINDSTLFQDTIMRLPEEASDPLIICNEEHRFIVAEQLRQINSKNKGIILEPVAKNTAPAVAIAAMNSISEGIDPVLLVLSADHAIDNKKQFLKSVGIAKKIAEKGKLVALGIKPTKPEIGYGYIEVKKIDNSSHYDMLSFKEKPNAEVAKKYIDSKKYYWNSGIFIFKASVYLSELKKYESEIFNICKKSCSKFTKDYNFIRVDKNEFSKCPNKSIDHAVMEKTLIGAIVPLSGGWNDVGSWETLWHSKSKDFNNNVSEGDVLLNKVKDSFIYSTNRLVAANNVSDIVIVDTEDALLVSSKKNSKNIKHIVQKLRDDNRNEADTHQKVYRPWGHYNLIDLGKSFQVKRIFVDPGAKLSLQKHKKRAEHWVVVNGHALITCGEKIFKLHENQSTYIPKGETHRLENYGTSPLEIIEIQTGDYFGEDDIIRFEDDYNRS